MNLSWGAVSYLCWRPAADATGTVVLLHGGGVDNAELSWGGIGPMLAQAGFRVLAPDHPGYGESPPAPWPATQQRLVDYVGEFVDALALEGYAVGGLSLGGGLTIGHVLQRPQRVSAAVLLGSYGIMRRLSVGPLSPIRQLVTWACVRTGLLQAATSSMSRSPIAMRATLTSLIRNPARRTPALMRQVNAAATTGAGLDAFAQWQRDQVRWNRLATDYTCRLRSFPRPALIVHGGRDAAVPVGCARAAAAEIPDARLVVVGGAGHWVQRDQPGLVSEAMTEFLAAIGKR